MNPEPPLVPWAVLYARWPVCCQLLDAQGRLRDVNGTWLAELGYCREEVVGRPFGDFLTPPSRIGFERQFPGFLAQGVIADCELELRASNGSTLTLVLAGVIFQEPRGDSPLAHCLLHNVTRWRRTEAALRASEAAFRGLFDTGPTAVSVVRGRIICQANALMSQISGYSETELLGQSARVHYPDDAEFERVGRELYGAMKRDGFGMVEARHRRKNGEIFDVLLCARPLETASPDPAIMVTLLDITERKRAEAALQSSQKLLNDSQRVVHIGSWELDLATHRLVWSDECYRIYGVDPQTFQPSFESFSVMAVPDDRPMIAAHFQETLASRFFRTFECRICRGDGVVRWLRITGELACDAAGVPVKLLGTQQDITDQRQAEQALRDSERHWQQTFDAIGDGVALISAAGLVFKCNSAMEKLAGHPAAEMVGRRCCEVFHHRADPVGDCPLVRVRQSRRRDVTELPLGERQFQITVDPLFNDAGELTGVVHLMSDITERKRAEAAVEKRVLALTRPLDMPDGVDFEDLFNLADIQRLQDLFAQACGVASIITRPDGSPITQPSNFCFLCSEIIRQTERGLKNCYCSDAILGQHNSQGPTVQPCLSGGLWDAGASITVGGRHIANWLIGQVRNETQDEERMMAYAREIGADESAFREAYRRVPVMSREKFELVAQTLFVVANQLSTTAYQNVQQARFITERKQAEIRISEQAALLDAANDAIYVRALDHTITYWNDGAERLFEIARAGALGCKITDHYYSGLEAFETAHAALLKQGGWSGELKRKNQAGREMVMFCRWTLLHDEQGRPKEVLAITTDITEQKRLEASFLRAQRMEGLGALAGGIAHDLNNILQPILMTVPMLIESATAAENRELLETVESCARRGADIIRQLLTFARGTPGDRVPLRVRHLLGEMDKIIHETFPRNIHVAVEAPPDLWLVMGDVTQIHQALMNLCVNARDAMPDGGRITLAAANQVVDEAFAAMTSGARPGPHVCVSVTDTGTGIPPEVQERIFDPFFTTKEIGKGTGLGLATVLGIMRGHGGFVRMSSQVGEGTRFELYFPASLKTQTDVAASEPTLPPRAAGELILVVDDEASVRKVIQRILERHGYQVMTASEGGEALALFARHQKEIRAVITDMMMPGMDGPTVVRLLRQQQPHLPIIGMTGIGRKADIKGLREEDLTLLLAKPFGGANLIETLHRILPASNSPRGIA